MSATIRILPPNWRKVRKATYEIEYVDNFEFNGSVRPTLLTKYHLTFTYIGEEGRNIVINVEWPGGIGPVIKHHQGISDLNELIDNYKSGQAFSCNILVSRLGDLVGVEDQVTLSSSANSSFSAILKDANDLQKHRVKAVLKSVVTDIESYLMKDVSLIYGMVGMDFLSPGLYIENRRIREDYMPDEFLDVDTTTRHIYYFENRVNGYLCVILQGASLFSSYCPDKLDHIKRDIMEGVFELDSYQDVNLSHSSFLIDNQSFLPVLFEKKHRISSPRMKKELRVLIKRLD